MTDAEILLVEDNPGDAELAAHALRRQNLAGRLAWVKDGEEALDLMERMGEQAHRRAGSLPKVVLLDLKLPKVDGIEVLRRAKSDTRIKDMPVVILSSSKEEQDLIACYEAGANSYVVKPLQFERFIEAVQEIGSYWTLLNEPPRPRALA